MIEKHKAEKLYAFFNGKIVEIDPKKVTWYTEYHKETDSYITIIKDYTQTPMLTTNMDLVTDNIQELYSIMINTLDSAFREFEEKQKPAY